MTDDIVTRLRHMIENLNKTVPQTMLLEAADEIERLRGLVEAWKDVAQELTMYAAMKESTEGLDD